MEGSVVFGRMICSVSKIESRNWGWRRSTGKVDTTLATTSTYLTRRTRSTLLDFWQRSTSMRLEAFLVSSRSLHMQATNQRQHAFKPCMPPPIPIALLSARRVSATHDPTSLVCLLPTQAASAEPAPRQTLVGRYTGRT